jgi:hypothetical protein
MRILKEHTTHAKFGAEGRSPKILKVSRLLAQPAQLTGVRDATTARPLPRNLPTALPPAHTIAAESGTLQVEVSRIGGIAGSDFMVDVIKTLDIKYLPANCASSYRGIHESLINYGGNKMPEFLTCTHEESAIGMAHGYFKVTGKPLMSLCHGTVDQHATMGIQCVARPRVISLWAATTLMLPSAAWRADLPPRKTLTRWSATSPSGTTVLQHRAHRARLQDRHASSTTQL